MWPMSNVTRETRIAIRVWLMEHGRTQVWLAQKIGVSESLLSKVMHGYMEPNDAICRGVRRITGINLRERAA